MIRTEPDTTDRDATARESIPSSALDTLAQNVLRLADLIEERKEAEAERAAESDSKADDAGDDTPSSEESDASAEAEEASSEQEGDEG